MRERESEIERMVKRERAHARAREREIYTDTDTERHDGQDSSADSQHNSFKGPISRGGERTKFFSCMCTLA